MTRVALVSCPATSANLGPGFDALGLALGLRNTFRIAPASRTRIVGRGGEGSGAERISADPAQSLIVRGFQAARAALKLAPVDGLDVEVDVEVPTGRGLGSSATAVVAGVVAANALAVAGGEAARGLDPSAVIELAVAIEGHADNIVPCVLGGVCAAMRTTGGRVVHARAAPANLPVAVAVVPLTLEKSTEAMRRLLPAQVPFGDAVDTVGRLSLLLFALLSGAPGAHDLLAHALDDRLHQPYRGPAIPAFEAARAAGRAAGAHGVVISGSGPTLLALAPDVARGEAAGAAIVDVWARAGVKGVARVVEIAREGARVEIASG